MKDLSNWLRQYPKVDKWICENPRLTGVILLALIGAAFVGMNAVFGNQTMRVLAGLCLAAFIVWIILKLKPTR